MLRIARSGEEERLDVLRAGAKGDGFGFRRGFSVIELLVALLVVGVLSSFAMRSFWKTRQAAQRARAVVEIHTLAAEIAQYDAAHGRLPKSLGEIGRAGFVDPSGRPYAYVVTSADAKATDRLDDPTPAGSGPSDYCVSVVASVAETTGRRSVASICSPARDSLEGGDRVGRLPRK